jgi:hypothetical protein
MPDDPDLSEASFGKDRPYHGTDGIDLNDESERIVRRGTAAWARLKKHRNWDDWMAVGEALLVGREFAMRDANTNRPIGKGYSRAFNQWLIDAKLNDMDQADRVKLLTVMEARLEIEQWRETLDKTQRMRLNHPTAVFRRWRQITTVPAPPKQNKKNMIAEYHHLIAENEQLKARITELEEENAELREQQREMEVPRVH